MLINCDLVTLYDERCLSISAPIMACCLTASSHYLSNIYLSYMRFRGIQCWGGGGGEFHFKCRIYQSVKFCAYFIFTFFTWIITSALHSGQWVNRYQIILENATIPTWKVHMCICLNRFYVVLSCMCEVWYMIGDHAKIGFVVCRGRVPHHIWCEVRIDTSLQTRVRHALTEGRATHF